MTWYHSPDKGRTWLPIPAPRPLSPLTSMVRWGQLSAGQVYDDGVGNLYRFEW